ncbi:uncharacterized protein LOC143424930 [Xylocopa sonorina]|uniref:uncharacterized protein LOC143424930 n=1 Tax=Xylocopa sonorina TaxID=1818115 RepID=UPI00403AF779
MESDQRCYELRSGSRSRSRTPFVQNRSLIEPETLEHHYDLRSQSRERSGTPGEVTNNRRSGSKILPVSGSKVNEQSTKTLPERRKQFVTGETMSDNTSKQDENSHTSAKKGERRSERQRAKKQMFANGQTETKFSVAPLTSDYSSEEGGRDEDSSNRPSSAHEIYRQAGDWWNVFPKTDYTYSERSQCRYEIAPGILAMPNMSRRSIHSNAQDFSRVEHNRSESGICETTSAEEENTRKTEERMPMSNEFYVSHTSDSDGKSKVRYKKTHVEQQYRCHREIIYTEPKISRQSLLHSDLPMKRIDSQKCDITSFVDSDTELEEAVSSKHNEKSKITRLTSFTSIVVLWFKRLFEFVKLDTIKAGKYRAASEYQRYESNKWFRIWDCVDRTLQYLYIFLVTVFFLDSWLLSHISNSRRWIRQKRLKVVWIALLPLLILTGTYIVQKQSFICLDSLHNIPYDVTETSYRIINDIISLTSFQTDLFIEYMKTFKDLSVLHLSSGANVSLPEMPYLCRLVAISNRAARLFNTSQPAGESGYVWPTYDSKLLLLEKKLEELKLPDTYTKEINDIKSQFERLREELKLSCNTRTDYVTSVELEKRMERFLANYISFLSSKTTDNVKVQVKSSVSGDNVLTDDRVREIVKEALKIYDADKTGRVDYALESAGGQIISTRCTQRYDVTTRAFKLLAFTLYYENNDPRTVIQGNPVQPGACWAFQDFPGYLLIKLRSLVYVTGFTIEHAPRSILPNEEMRSAPKKFNVWGFVDENDSAPVMFGDYEFEASDESLQYFPVQNTAIDTAYEYVELRIHSNHGQLEYTCLYRFRVHGKPIYN